MGTVPLASRAQMSEYGEWVVEVCVELIPRRLVALVDARIVTESSSTGAMIACRRKGQTPLSGNECQLV